MAQNLVKAEEKSMVPTQWNPAWDEFGRRYPRLKHGPALLAFSVFTFLGQSVVGVISVFYGLLPLIVWLLVLLSTTVLAQMFVINFSGKAYERKMVERAAESEKLREHKLKLEIDGSNTRIRVEQHGSEESGLVIRIWLAIQLRFENLDPVHSISMKKLDFGLHREWKIFSLGYLSPGIVLMA